MRRLMTTIAAVVVMAVFSHAQADSRTVQAGSTPVPAYGSPLRSIVRAGDTLYISGQIGNDPTTDEVVSGGVSEEVRQALENVKRLIESEGASLAQVVKCTVFLIDMSEFDAMNKVYRTFFSEQAPARTTVQVTAMPDSKAHVEIDCIAFVP